jgi:hypothetical protein
MYTRTNEEFIKAVSKNLTNKQKHERTNNKKKLKTQ